MRLLFSALIAGVFVISATVFAAPLQTSPWSLISVPRTATALHFFDLLPVMAEGGTRERIHAEAKAEEIQTLREWGLDVEVLVSDIQQLRPFSVGNSFPWLMSSWDTYHDSDQIEVSLRLLVEQFPQVSRLIQIGTSVQGRPIFGVLLSDTPWAREYDEPALRVIGGHHGDEWAATETTLATAWHFAEGYETNSSIRDLLDQQSMPVLKTPTHHFQSLAQRNRHDNESMSGIRLGYLIRDKRDFFVVPLHRSTPNFVTSKRIEGTSLRLDNHAHGKLDLTDRIVCIENADPGFDWIFTRGIAGLVSQYGGANSHMTIRCAELGLPAAIGVGGQTFERVASADLVELDAGARIIRPIYG